MSNGADVNGPAPIQVRNQLNIQAAKHDTLNPVKLLLAFIFSAHWRTSAVCVHWLVKYRGFSSIELTFFFGAKLKSGGQDLVT